MNEKPETLRSLVATYLAEQCQVLIDAEPQLRAGEPVVHTTRVAVRRLRSTLRTCAELFDQGRVEALEPELVWWAGLLGAVRDLDILAERMSVHLSQPARRARARSGGQHDHHRNRRPAEGPVRRGDRRHGLTAVPGVGHRTSSLAERAAVHGCGRRSGDGDRTVCGAGGQEA